jgi:hypothetical protein
MLLERQWLLHYPQANPLAFQQHPDSWSRNLPQRLHVGQVLISDNR